MNRRQIGGNLRRLRQSRDYLQSDLADMLDVSQSTIGMYENDQRVPPLDMLMRYAMIFGVTLDELCGLEPAEPMSDAKVQCDNEDKIELLHIYDVLGRRERHELMVKAYELERKI